MKAFGLFVLFCMVANVVFSFAGTPENWFCAAGWAVATMAHANYVWGGE